ncbi:MAG: hypothetical protein ABJA37_09800 [Ferruginibacter sp.]
MGINLGVRKKYFLLAELVIIVLLACVPLFFTFPYRVNIFLSWEGAYRMSNGQLPFRDFGIPLGGMYWLIPAIFFKIFGAQMISLIKAQVFINIISGLAFRSILKTCGVQPGLRLGGVLLYCISFSFFNFWPWYNHTVIVFEFVGLAFLFKAVTTQSFKTSSAWLVVSAFFICCSFFTKQDAGGMAFMFSFLLLFYSCLRNKKWIQLLIFTGTFAIILFLFVAPFLKYGFGYWFNHGQAPHSSRISAFEIVDEFFSNSQWLRFYLFFIGIILMIRFRSLKELWLQKIEMLFLILTLGILGEAAIFQVTSYTPPDNNIFFHSFAIVYILYSLSQMLKVDMNKIKMVIVCSIGILLWWSNVYWKYIQRMAERAFPHNDEALISATGENIVNRKTFMLNSVDTTDAPRSGWVFSNLKSFEKIYMPASTVAGIDRIIKMEMVKTRKNLSVLNMSELTPLANEIPYQLEKGPAYPLWYHLGVGMFNKQAEMFEKKIANKEYDLVLFEFVPKLNNFYPFRVRDTLLNHYNKVDSFLAPRSGDTRGIIEVYIK